MNSRQKEVIAASLDDEKAVLSALEKNYTTALADIKRNIKELQSNPLTQSKAYQLDFQKQLERQISGILDNLSGKNFASIADYLNTCYQTGFVGAMYDLQGQGLSLILPIDQNQVLKAVQKTSDDIKLVNKIGVSTKELKGQVLEELKRGFASDLTYTDIARNISNRGQANMGRSMTIARTEGHRVQSEAKMDSYHAAKEKGADIVKQWDATLDGATRDTHRMLDGQVRELDEDFTALGVSAPYPGGFGDPAEDCNCRCCMLQRARWAVDEETTYSKWNNQTGGIIQCTGYDDFKEKYLKAVENYEESGIIEMPQFTPATSIKEAEAFARETLGIDCSYKGVDLEVANEMNAAFQRGLSACPEVQERLNFVGSGQERNAAYKSELTTYYKDMFKEKYPGRSDEWYDKNAKRFANHTVGRIESKTYAFASSGARTGDAAFIDITQKYSGIVVNNAWGKDAESFAKALANDVRTGWHPLGCDKIASVFDHEMGHQIDYALGLRTNHEITELFRSLSQKEIGEGLSRYGTTIPEFIAEGWAEYTNSEHPREIATKIGEIIKKAVKSK